MSRLYGLLYRIGFTPWDTNKAPAELQAIAEGADALPPSRALDLGCGTGTQAVYLSRLGWQVTAVDSVERALEQARARDAASGATLLIWAMQPNRRLLEPAGADGVEISNRFAEWEMYQRVELGRGWYRLTRR